MYIWNRTFKYLISSSRVISRQTWHGIYIGCTLIAIITLYIMYVYRYSDVLLAGFHKTCLLRYIVNYNTNQNENITIINSVHITYYYTFVIFLYAFYFETIFLVFSFRYLYRARWRRIYHANINHIQKIQNSCRWVCVCVYVSCDA